MKKVYEAPSVELTRFDAEDIILTSMTTEQKTVLSNELKANFGSDANYSQEVFYDETFNW